MPIPGKDSCYVHGEPGDPGRRDEGILRLSDMLDISDSQFGSRRLFARDSANGCSWRRSVIRRTDRERLFSTS
jgi:hypothetical protein